MLVLASLVALPRAARAEERRSIVWDDSHPRVVLGEHAFAVMTFLSSLTIETGTRQPTKPRWVGPILFDRAVRDALVGRTPAVRSRAVVAADALWVIAMSYPVAVDAIALPAVDRNADLFEQLWVIDGEVYGLTYLLTRAGQRLVARSRPSKRGCETEHGWASECSKGGETSSFPSGHTSMAAVGAGVTCAHHAFLHLYGGGAPDVVACAGETAIAASVGVLRIVGDRHWTSDVLTGFALGYGIGLGLPIAMHYGLHTPAGARSPGARRELPAAPAMFAWGGVF